MDARTLEAAQRSQYTRQTFDVTTLPRRALQYLCLAIVGIFTRLLSLCVPNDPVGMYCVVRDRLDKEFGVTNRIIQSDVCIAAATAIQALPPSSRESKSIMAVVCAAGLVQANDIVNSDSKYHDTDESRTSEDDEGDGQHADDDDTLSYYRFLQARSDYRRLAVGQTLDRVTGKRKRRTDAAVASVLEFLFRRDNTSTVSWGSTKLKFRNKLEVIQARNRLRSVSALWALYDVEHADTPRKDRVQRTSFFQLAGAITARDLKV